MTTSQPDYEMPAGLTEGLDYEPIGYQGLAQHTYTSACDGFHKPGQCPTPDGAEAAQ